MLRLCLAALLGCRERFERRAGEVEVGDDATALPLLLLVVASGGLTGCVLTRKTTRRRWLLPHDHERNPQPILKKKKRK
jgi:hypothetical protein